MAEGNVIRILSLVHFITQLIGTFSFDYQHPEKWTAEGLECNGTYQSPVNIRTSEIKEVLPTNLIMSGDEIKPTTVKVTNNGHSVEFLPTYASERPSISGGPLSGTYVFDRLHFHWSNLIGRGSEHTVDEKHFALEMHLLYYKQIYGSLEKASLKPDGLSVIGVIFDVPTTTTITPNNAVLTPIINGLTKVKKSGETANLDPFPISIFGLKKSYLTKYLTYNGSSTTPPCLQIVTWLLCWDIQSVTSEQMKAFREVQLAHSDKENDRATQAVHGRVFKFVWNSKSDPKY